MTALAVLPALIGGLPCVRLQAADGAATVVSAWGAQVLSWRPAGGEQRLFVSANAVLDGSAPLRGGVPVVFPQFAGYGPLPAHGFARDRGWAVREAGGDSATLVLGDDEATRALWPHAFGCEFTVRVGDASLAMELRVTNRGTSPWAFQAALHTYLRVLDLESLRVEGLGGAAYLDRSAGDRSGREERDALRIAGETDRIYPDAARRVTVREPGRATEVNTAGGFTDLVAWNPGAERCARIADFERDAWREMLCIEAACITRPPTLGPGQTWRGEQVLTAA